MVVNPNPILRVFFKIFMIPFFIRMTGFLFLIYYIMFGMVHGGELIYYHISLVIGCLTDFRFFFLMIILWTLYYLRIYFLIMKFSRKPVNEFLKITLPVLPIQELRRALYSMVLFLSSPVWIYVLFMEGVALYHKLWIQAFLVLVFHAGMMAILTHFLSKMDRDIFQIPNLNSILKSHPLTLPRKIHFSALNYLWINQKNMLLLGKALSLILLFISIWINHEYSFDLRVPVLFWIISLTFQYNLVLEITQFENRRLKFLRNMPLNILRIWAIKMANLFLLILPEVLLILFYPMFPDPLNNDGIMILLGIGILSTFYSMAIIPRFFPGSELSPVLFLFFSYFF